MLLGGIVGYMSADDVIVDVEMSKEVSAVLQGDIMRTYKGKTIKKRSDGRYWTRYYDNDNVQRSLYGKTADEVVRKLRKALAVIKEKATPHKITLGEWLDTWLKLYKVKQVKDSTLRKCERYGKAFAPMHSMAIADITTMQLQQFLMAVDSSRTRELLLTFIKDVMDKACKNGYTSANPAIAVKIPKHIKGQRHALTLDEQARIVGACYNSKYGAMFLLCLYQGLRIGEVKALSMADFNFDKGTLTIDKAINEFNRLDTPKSATSIRTLPIFKGTKDMLQVLPFNILQRDNTIYKHWGRIQEQAQAYCTIHELRHTFATRCAEVGISAKVTQQWLGHSTLDMTLNIYTHVTRDFEAKEVCKLDTCFDT